MFFYSEDEDYEYEDEDYYEYEDEVDYDEKQGNTQEEVKVTEDGIFIKGKFFTKEEFEDLLQNAVEITTESNLVVNEESDVAFCSFILAAGVYAIPGVGQVLVAASGAIFIGGTAIAVGSWAYNKVARWAEGQEHKKETKKDYENAKRDGRPTNNHTTKKDGNLDLNSDPYSSKDLLNKDGSVKQRRYYNKKGKADIDIDYNHGGVGHTFPHKHQWNGNIRD